MSEALRSVDVVRVRGGVRASETDRGMTRVGWIAMLACVWIAPLGAQLASGELRIVVTDATGLPVSASGTLASDASQTHRSFDTGAAGTFTFDRLPDGRYHLTVSSAGLRTHDELLEIRSALPREVP
jgi:hypothetical protein